MFVGAVLVGIPCPWFLCLSTRHPTLREQGCIAWPFRGIYLVNIIWMVYSMNIAENEQDMSS